MFALVHGRPLQAAVASIVANDDPAAVFEVVDIDHGSKVKDALKLKHGISGMLLAGGHWRGSLDLDDIGGKRLRAFVNDRGLTVPIV